MMTMVVIAHPSGERRTVLAFELGECAVYSVHHIVFPA
jgi:hypothetical protein